MQTKYEYVCLTTFSGALYNCRRTAAVYGRGSILMYKYGKGGIFLCFWMDLMRRIRKL